MWGDQQEQENRRDAPRRGCGLLRRGRLRDPRLHCAERALENQAVAARSCPLFLGVMVISMHDDPLSRSRARAAGATTFIAKHDMGHELVKFLEAVIPESSKVCGASDRERQ